uniref:Uncharacterized protein n=1 Tax=Oryza meridionalis TaxID=40149 RepID=A0A0E0EG92_9ORYZ
MIKKMGDRGVQSLAFGCCLAQTGLFCLSAEPAALPLSDAAAT